MCGPAALIFIFPSFWVRLGAAETMNVSHVRVNVGRGGLKRFIPKGSLQIVELFLQIGLRRDFTHTHTHTTPSGPLDLFELLTCLVWPGVKEARCYLGFGKVGLKRLHLRIPDLMPQCMPNMSVNP